MFSIQGSKAIHDEEAKHCLKVSYYSQRSDINKLTSIDNLLKSWPLLFTETGLFTHFTTLVGIDMQTKLKESMESKGEKVILYFRDDEKPKMKELFRKYACIKPCNYYILVISLLMEYFSEKEDILFKHVEVSSL